jgi:cyclopropane-fatty-acyl-phospholipid synthase
LFFVQRRNEGHKLMKEMHMNSHESLVKDLLCRAGITVNGPNPWDIQVHDDRFYRRVWRDKNLGLGESYMAGWWDCRQVDEFICRLLKSGLDGVVTGSLRHALRRIPMIFFNRQSRDLAHIIAMRHYDLDNDMFLSFLDTYNQYSCGYFKDTADLAQAQENKLRLICEKISILPDDRVLDIGCGWGGFAKYAAERYGCTVTAVNISKHQIRHASALCRHLPVRIRQCDYRDIRGEFDKIVSIGMFEHVGRKNYRQFMNVVHGCLKDHGIFLLHTIGSNRSGSNFDLWLNRYIFPNSMLPSVAQIAAASEGLFVVEDLHNLGPHYDSTLMAWRRNFRLAWTELKTKYDETFKRMWDYYFLSSAGAFRARGIQTWQIVFTKIGTPQPDCRCT